MNTSGSQCIVFEKPEIFSINCLGDPIKDELDHYNFMTKLIEIHPWAHDWYVDRYDVKGWEIVYDNQDFKYYKWSVHEITISELTCIENDIDLIISAINDNHIKYYIQCIDQKYQTRIVKSGKYLSIRSFMHQTTCFTKSGMIKLLDELKELIHILPVINKKKEMYFEYLDNTLKSKSKSARF